MFLSKSCRPELQIPVVMLQLLVSLQTDYSAIGKHLALLWYFVVILPLTPLVLCLWIGISGALLWENQSLNLSVKKHQLRRLSIHVIWRTCISRQKLIFVHVEQMVFKRLDVRYSTKNEKVVRYCKSTLNGLFEQETSFLDLYETLYLWPLNTHQ